ncbi:MAG: TonB-dependent receptor [Bacteroidota bacterium]|nr:MAG: TonB-dependent receptor [Bacteroidota bacterium]
MKKIITIFFLLSLFIMSWGQEKMITGKVSSADLNEPLPGVNVFVIGTSRGVITDINGNYEILVSEGETLIFSFVGYLEEEKTIGSESLLNVSLVIDILSMDEVYVVGYGTQKKSVITGSIAKIGAEDLDKSTDLRIEQAIQGKAAGVMVMNNSGQPGDNLTIRIRGVGTYRNADPLYIVDGVPMTGQGMDYLNTSDIESIEVLKDASASAIYGTRGANGVIIITTKKGKKGTSISVTYDGFYGVQNAWKKQDLLNSEQYIEIMNEAQANDGRSTPLFDDATIDLIRTNGWDTDWQKEIYNANAVKTSHSLTFMGGGEDNTYSSSLSYFKQEGIIAPGKSNFERFTYRLGTSRTIGNFEIGSNINLANLKRRGIEGNNMYGLGLNQAINMQSIVPVKYEDGTWGTPSDFGVGLQEITNPVALLEYHNSRSSTNKALGNIYGVFEIVKGLKFRTDFGGEIAYVQDNSYAPLYYIDANHVNDSLDYATAAVNKYVRWNWENNLSYVKEFNEHSITGIVGITLFKEYNENVWAKKQDLIFDDPEKAYLNNAQNPNAEASGGYGEHTLGSYFGRINYSYADKYLLEAVLRVDGSSRFGANNRYGYFPAVSAGWVLSQESFFPQTTFFNFAKLRMSWGQNGNEGIPDFAYTTTINTNNIYFYGSQQTMVNGIQPSRYPNPDLIWETSEQFTIGTDLAFLSNKISLAVDVYNKKTKDWLIEESNANYPLLIGNVGPVTNTGEVKNSGVEIELGYKQKIAGDLLINVSFTGSHNQSKILSLENSNGYILGAGGIHGQSNILRLEVEEPLGYFHLVKTDGVFQTQEEINNYTDANGKRIQPQAKPGDLKFVDADSSGSIDDGDRVNLGTPYPKFIAGLNLTLEWKGIDFSMFWYTSLGHQIYNASRRYDLQYANYTTAVLERWNGEGTSDSYPRVTLADPNKTYKTASDFFLEDADFLRLKNLTIGYTLPKSMSSIIKIDRFRIYLTGENLLTFTKYSGMEVEMGGGPLDIGVDRGVYPQPKTYLVGLQVGF